MQTLTPTSTITNTNWTVTGASAEAACADDSTATYCTTSSATNELELKFTTPSQTPLPGNIRFRLVLKGGGSVALRLMEGSTELQTGALYSLPAEFEERTLVLTAAPSAWTDLRCEIIASKSGVAVSEVFLDVGDGALDPTDDRYRPFGQTGRVFGFKQHRIWAGLR